MLLANIIWCVGKKYTCFLAGNLTLHSTGGKLPWLGQPKNLLS